jgi:hypothetical protein
MTSRASPRCDFRLDLAVASTAYSKSIIEAGELDPERGNVNDCAVDEVLRRHNDAQDRPCVTGISGATDVSPFEEHAAVPLEDDVNCGVGAVILAMIETSSLGACGTRQAAQQPG